MKAFRDGVAGAGRVLTGGKKGYSDNLLVGVIGLSVGCWKLRTLRTQGLIVVRHTSSYRQKDPTYTESTHDVQHMDAG